MEEALIVQKIKLLQKRYQLVNNLVLVLKFTFFGIIAAAVFLAFIKITGFMVNSYYYFVVPIFISVIASLIYGRFQKVSLMEVALRTDEKIRLKEKLSTALEWIEKNRARTPMFRALLRETAKASEKIIPSEIFRFRWKKQALKIIASSAVVVILIYVPPLSLFSSPADPAQTAVIKKEAEKIKQTAEKLEKKEIGKPKSPARIKSVAKAMKKLSGELEKPGIKKREALAKISKVQQQIKDRSKRYKQLQRIIESLRQSEGTTSGKADQKRAGEFEKIQRQLKQAAVGISGKKISETGKKEVLDKLENLKKKMESAGMKTDKISQAIRNIQQGNFEQAAGALREESESMAARQATADEAKLLKEAYQQLEASKNKISGRQMSSRLNSGIYQKKEGDAPADFGEGSTNKEIKSEKEPGKIYTDRKSDDKSAMKGLYKKLYESIREERETATGKIRGKIGKGPVIRSLSSGRKGAPKLGGDVQTKPVETYLEYRTRGEEAVRREKIPARYRDLIRNYYDSIDPRQTDEM